MKSQELYRGKGWYRIIGHPGFLFTLNKRSSIHRWKYWFVLCTKENGDLSISTWNKRRPNKTWNKVGMTLNEKEMTTINYFRVIDSVHPRSGKSIKVPSNWLPRWILFDYECFLCAIVLCSAIPHSNLITAHTFDLLFFALSPLILFQCAQVRLSAVS